jgi:hypothetical protein
MCIDSVLLNFWTLSIMQGSEEHKISETGSPILRRKCQRHLRMETDPVFKTFCSLTYQMMSSNSVILSLSIFNSILTCMLAEECFGACISLRKFQKFTFHFIHSQLPYVIIMCAIIFYFNAI